MSKIQEVDIAVNPIGNLMWTAPLSREDETSLNPNDISHYNLYYGNGSGDYIHDVQVPASNLYYEFDFKNAMQLPLYVVMTTVDTEGRESVFSEEVSFVKKTYNPKPPHGLVAGLKQL